MEGEEKKKYSVKYHEGNVVAEVDLNQDGEPLLKFELDIKEIPEEAIAAWHAAKGK